MTAWTADSPEFAARWERLARRLAKIASLSHPYPFRPSFAGRPAAVLILCALRAAASPESTPDFEILMTRRTDRLETHKGQYALPGGSVDAEDGPSDSESRWTSAALRETEEEMGISRAAVETFGTLPPIWTPSGFLVTPVVGLLREPLEGAAISPSEIEIDAWFWCAMDRLRSPGVYTQEMRVIKRDEELYRVAIDVYQVDEHRVWGATAAILKNFIGRWEKLG